MPYANCHEIEVSICVSIGHASVQPSTMSSQVDISLHRKSVVGHDAKVPLSAPGLGIGTRLVRSALLVVGCTN